MAMDAFEEDIARPFGAAPRGAAAGAKLVAILKPGATSWTVPKASKYTFHVWGPGGAPNGGAGAGGYARKTVTLPKGAQLTVSVGAAGARSADGTNKDPSGSTTISGPGIAVTCTAGSNIAVATVNGGTATGGDINIAGGSGTSGDAGGAAGGDGSAIGTGGLGAPSGSPGGHPGGGGGAGNGSISFSGHGEIRIVDETP